MASHIASYVILLISSVIHRIDLSVSLKWFQILNSGESHRAPQVSSVKLTGWLQVQPGAANHFLAVGSIRRPKKRSYRYCSLHHARDSCLEHRTTIVLFR